MEKNDDAIVTAVLAWRKRLSVDIGVNRAAKARLRRCGATGEALFERETIELIKAARAAAGEGRALSHDRLALLAIVLAHEPKGASARFAAVLGRTAEGRAPVGEERPRLSPARFAAMIRAAHAGEWDNFCRALRRVFAILGDTGFDIPAFIRDILYLDERVLQRWTYDYWQTRPPEDIDDPQNSTAPDSSTPTGAIP